MGETLIRYSMFFLIIILLAVLSMTAQKFRIVGAFFLLLRKLLTLLILVVWGGIIIFSFSFLACICIGLAAFFVEENLFVYAGERINPLDPDHSNAMIKLSATYGLLYFFTYIACALLFSRFRFNRWLDTALIALTTTFIVVITYPLFIHSLFSDLTVSMKGALFLILTIFLIVLGHRRKENEDTYIHIPVLHALFQLIPFLSKKGKKPVNNNKPTSF